MPYVFCGEGGCEYKSKQKVNIKSHKANIHKSKQSEGRTDSAISTKAKNHLVLNVVGLL